MPLDNTIIKRLESRYAFYVNVNKHGEYGKA